MIKLSRNYTHKTVAATLMLILMVATDAALAQVGGGTGNAAAVQTRATDIMASWQGIMFAIGATVLSGAGMWTGYSMAFAQKKWSDVANVCYGCAIAGGFPMIVAWLFS